MCDQVLDIVVYDDGTDEYAYELISTKGNCSSNLYIWDGLKSYKLSEAIELEIVRLDDFLNSDFVIRRPISTE